MSDHMTAEQIEICHRHGALPLAVAADDKVGIARNVLDGIQPIHGMRVEPTNGTSGWYIWAGEGMSDAADFFLPLHARHVPEWCEAAVRFLMLPPGWRFLIAGEYVDVWFDPKLA